MAVIEMVESKGPEPTITIALNKELTNTALGYLTRQVDLLSHKLQLGAEGIETDLEVVSQLKELIMERLFAEATRS